MPNPIRRRRLGGQQYPMLAAHITRSASQSLSIADASQTGLNPGTSDFTVAFWAKPDSLGSAGFPIGKGATSSAVNVAQGYEILNNSTAVQVLLADVNNTTRLNFVSSFGLLSVGVWAHVVLSFVRAGSMTLYFNGAASGTLVISSQPASITTTAAFAVGAQSLQGGTLANSWDGALDTVAFWQRALSAAEAALLYNNGTGLAARDLTPTLKTSLISWWDLDGSGIDAVGTNNLANNNGVSYVTGKR